MRRVLFQIVIGAMRDSFELLGFIGKWEHVFDVSSPDGIEGTFVSSLLAWNKLLGIDSKFRVPSLSHVAPIRIPFVGLVRVTEELDFHLFEFAATEGVVPWIDLVPKRLADLRNPERQLYSRTIHHVFEVREDALRSFRSQIRHSRFF